MVIDDSRANLLAMEGLLASLGHPLVLAESAEVGLSHLATMDVALVVTDVRMPGVDGFEMLSRLRGRAAERTVPVVFLSGYGYDSEHAHRAYKLGAVDYIVKPIDPDILRAKIAALVTMIQQARQIEEAQRDIAASTLKAEIARTEAAIASAQASLAESAVREKDRHIGVLGHDLRTPLSTITIGLHMLSTSQNLSEAERSKMARLERSARRMADMVRDLLDYTRTSQGEFPHNPSETDLQEVCDAAVDELRAVHPMRDISVQANGDVTGRWDAGRLQQVVSNLVGNALEHTQGRVSVRIEDAAREVVLSVHNDGLPIPMELLPTLFEPFRRGDRSPNGLGLGLYIVREVIHRHGGTVEVTSSGGEGTTFAARLPRHVLTPGNGVGATLQKRGP
jgi:signal transduction histidine kinase